MSTAVTNCWQLWQLLQNVSSFESCYDVVNALTVVANCGQLWQLLQAVDSIDICYKLLAALTPVTRCWQLWHPTFDSCYKLSRTFRCYKLPTILTAVTLWTAFAGSWLFWQLNNLNLNLSSKSQSKHLKGRLDPPVSDEKSSFPFHRSVGSPREWRKILTSFS